MELKLIQSKIYEIRGQRVMLDYDLEIYGIETRALKQAVRRNIKRFGGDDFMFELTRDEYNSLRSQFVILESPGRGKYSKYLPFSFGELGVSMLSSVLNSDTAIEINRGIMRAFVAARNVLIAAKDNNQLTPLLDRIKALEEVSEETLAAINDLSEDTRKEFDDIYIALSELATKHKEFSKPRNAVGYVKPSNKK